MKTQANKRLWAALAALYIVLLLHLVHYLRSSGEKSVSLQALAIAVIGIALGVFVMTVFSARSEPIGKRAGRSKWLSTLALTGGLAALFILGVEMRPEWVYTHLALTLAVTLAAVNYTLLSPPRLSRRLWVSTLIALAVAITFIRLRGLSYYPALHPIDEPWVLGWALSITRSGRLSDWIMVDRDISLNIYYVLVGGWLKLFGIGLWQGRAFSFVLVHVVILLTALAAKNLYGKRAAWFTAAALFTSVIMMSGARLRHDIGLAVSIAAALWLWSEANTRRKSSFHFAAGIALGSGLASHYHAPFFGVALTIAFYGPSFFLGRKNRWCTLKNLVLFGVGGLVTAILIITIQPIPSGGTAAYLQIASLSDLLASVRQHVANISYFSQYEFVLLALGVGAALLRREERDAVVLCAVLLGHLGLAIASPSGLGMYYLLPLTPFYGLLIGSLFDKGGGLKFGKLALPSSSTVAVCTFFMIVNLGATLYPPLSHVYRGSALEPAPTAPARWVLENVSPGKSIVGEHIHYLWLTDYRYVSPLAPNLMRTSRRTQFDTLSAVWEDINPDVFLVDEAGSTYPLLSPLIRDGYFQKNGYVEAARFGSTTIYAR